MHTRIVGALFPSLLSSWFFRGPASLMKLYDVGVTRLLSCQSCGGNDFVVLVLAQWKDGDNVSTFFLFSLDTGSVSGGCQFKYSLGVAT